MYMYIDKYDYLLNNLNNEEIEEEIDFSSNKLADIEESNHTFFKNLVAKVEAEKLANSKIDLQSESVYQNRYENLTAQIFTLQMKQFAESIWHIKRDPKKNKYVLIFDVSEAIEPLTLDEGAYKELIKYRDPMNSISVYDLFQEKIFSYYNTGSSPNKVTNKKGEGPKKRGRKPKKKTSDLKTDIVAKGQGKGPGRGKCRGRKSLVIKTGMKKFTTNSNVSPKKKQEEVEIAKVVNINYDFCHHCKQRKPAEVMVRCNSSHCHKYIEKPLKTFIVNNTTLVRSKVII